MKSSHFLSIALSFVLINPVFAYETQKERIDSYLTILDTGSSQSKEQMLSRLQWFGSSSPALFDGIEQRLLDRYQQEDIDRNSVNELSHMVRSLGYSGNEKYRESILLVSKGAGKSKVRKHAKKALKDLPKFSQWVALLPEKPAQQPGQSIESATYLAMLKVNNVFVQRLAARAIFHERNSEALLLDQAALLIENSYLSNSLDRESEDTVAWLCKAIGQSGEAKYLDLLSRVAAEAPSRKIKKYARQYAS